MSYLARYQRRQSENNVKVITFDREVRCLLSRYLFKSQCDVRLQVDLIWVMHYYAGVLARQLNIPIASPLVACESIVSLCTFATVQINLYSQLN